MAKISNEEFDKITLQVLDIMVDMTEETFNETVEMFGNQDLSEQGHKFLDELVRVAENRRAKKRGAA